MRTVSLVYAVRLRSCGDGDKGPQGRHDRACPPVLGTTPGTAGFFGYLCTLLGGENRKRVRYQLRFLFLFLGGALDIVGRVGTAIAFAAHLELAGLAATLRPAIVPPLGPLLECEQERNAELLRAVLLIAVGGSKSSL